MDENQKAIVDILKKYRPWEKERSPRTFLMDCIPQEKLLINTMMAAYEIGICDALKEDNTSQIVYMKYTNRLIKEYGLSEENAIWSISTWCYVFDKEIEEKDIDEASSQTGSIPIENGVAKFMKKSNRYKSISRLQCKVNNGSDIEDYYGLLSLYYGVLVNPSFDAKRSEIQWLAKKCLDISNRILEENVEDSISNKYRQLRIRWNRSFLYMILGQFTNSYENYVKSVNLIDRFYMDNNFPFSGGCFFMFYMSEINIHILNEAFGINDEDFFVVEKEEIEWFRSHCDLDLGFENDKKNEWTMAGITVQYSHTLNPFYSVYDSQGSESKDVCYNKRTTKIRRTKTGIKIIISPMGNIEFCGAPPKTNWEILFSSAVYEEARDYIKKNKYKKGNNYIHNTCGFSNASKS